MNKLLQTISSRKVIGFLMLRVRYTDSDTGDCMNKTLVFINEIIDLSTCVQ